MNVTRLRPARDATAGDAALLLDAAVALAAARELADVTEAVRESARFLSGADGVTFVLREGDCVHYVDEDAIAPLWKGQRFPASACISGWAMTHRRSVVIEDIYADERIPHDAYRRTFVASLAMIPVRPEDPVAAIGAYWAARHRATSREVQLLETLAGLASVALANVALLGELRLAVKSRDEFVGLASHELRTPLTPLRLEIDALSRRLERGQPVGDLPDRLARMRRNVERLRALVDEMLDTSRVSAGRLALEPERLDVTALVRAVADRLGAPDGRVVVEAAASLVEAWADPRRIEQVVENLVSNALKFGGDRPVRIRVDRADGRARIAVSDDGPGVSPEDQARIFERFERAAPARHFGGLGLGLWLVREIVEAHGGRVTLESSPGRGSIFTVLLPEPVAAPQAP
jgi:signal transduction histidine kinase